MLKDTITAVKKAESEAALLAKKTEEIQHELLEQAKKDALIMKQQQDKQISDYTANVERKAHEKNIAMIERAEARAREKIQQLNHHAEEKKMEAIQLILDTIG